jgi:peptidylprolyl isomerase
MGGSKKKDLKAEFNDISHVRGVLSMARSSNPDSANSQFFIVLKDSTFLDNQYTAFGRVVEGMELVDKIKKGDSRDNGKVSDPDKIVKMTVAADEAKTAPAKAEKPVEEEKPAAEVKKPAKKKKASAN